MDVDNKSASNPMIDALFSAGAHLGYAKSRRHPSITPYIFGVKDRVEIFDLHKTKDLYEKAEIFMKELGAAGKTVLFLSNKMAARAAILSAGQNLSMPYVAGRWIGGTLTNFKVIRSRVDRYLSLVSEREKGELAKYTKKERLMIDRDIAKLESLFGGLIKLESLPAAMIIVDPKEEETAIREAKRTGVKVVALMGSDCDVSDADYPVVGNDSTRKSISHFIGELTEAYKEGSLTRTANTLQQ